MNEDLKAAWMSVQIMDQRARIEKLEAALRMIAGYQPSPVRQSAIKIARAALDKDAGG